jgi:hypothetical protein
MDESVRVLEEERESCDCSGGERMILLVSVEVIYETEVSL